MKISKAAFIRALPPGTKVTLIRSGFGTTNRHRTVKTNKPNHIVFTTPENTDTHLTMGPGTVIEETNSGWKILEPRQFGDNAGELELACEYIKGHVGEHCSPQHR